MHAPEGEPDGIASLGQTRFLAQRAQIGDRTRFDELYARVEPLLYAWMRLRLQTNPVISPDDLLQEVWLRALHSLDSYDPARSFRSWILGIAKNVLLQTYEKRSNDLAGAAGPLSSDSAAFEVPGTVTSVSLRVSKVEALRRFMAYVEGLEGDDRNLLIYCGLEEQTCAQAAARLGISVDATSKRWQILRARLRESGVLETLALELSG